MNANDRDTLRRDSLANLQAWMDRASKHGTVYYLLERPDNQEHFAILTLATFSGDVFRRLWPDPGHSNATGDDYTLALDYAGEILGFARSLRGFPTQVVAPTEQLVKQRLRTLETMVDRPGFFEAVAIQSLSPRT